MDESTIWGILETHLEVLTGSMLSLKKGTWTDVYYDADSGTVAVGVPSAGIKIARMTGVDDETLADTYVLYRKTDHYETEDGEVVTQDALPAYLAQSIRNLCRDGAEWGWEFKVEASGG